MMHVPMTYYFFNKRNATLSSCQPFLVGTLGFGTSPFCQFCRLRNRTTRVLLGEPTLAATAALRARAKREAEGIQFVRIQSENK